MARIRLIQSACPGASPAHIPSRIHPHFSLDSRDAVRLTMTNGRHSTLRSRSSHLRIKIFALLTALAALWIFAAVVTVRDGVNVLFVGASYNQVGLPTEQLVDALQQERRLSSAASDGEATPEQRDALAASRSRTDEAIARWRDLVLSGGLPGVTTGSLGNRIDVAEQRLGALAELRDEVDRARLDHHATVAAFTVIIDACFSVYSSLSALDDVEIAQQSDLLIDLSRARELLSQQDALLAGALRQPQLTDRDIEEVTRLVVSRRFLYDHAAADLLPESAALYRATVEGPTVTELHRVEDLLLEDVDPGDRPPLSAAEWEATAGPALSALRDMELTASDNLVGHSAPVATGVIVRLVLAGGLGLVAVVAAVVVSITTARSLLRQLERLRDAARELAERRLPRVVAKLSAGEEVDVAAEAPPLRFGDDVIGQVGQAFNAVQETAVRAAVRQAELRHGVRDVFLSLARRTQSLVHRQLRVLDGMERRQTDPDEVEDLFRVDHLATRMRRNAENLIVLSGAAHGRTWRHPVPMIDVIRGALAEVEDYTRVTLLPVESGALAGHAVGDVIHLLAELIENAVSFSPPYAAVTVGGQRVAHGFAVEIEDRGLGMNEDDLATANRLLADPPDFSVADPSRLGHYVVAKLAQRHEVSVHLRRSPYGGTIAIVLLPAALISGLDGDGGPSALVAPAAGGPGATTAGANGAGGGASGGVGAAGAGGGVERGAATVLERRALEAAPSARVDGQPAPPLPVRASPGTPTGPAPAARAVGSAEVAPAADAPPRTPSGLPWRVRQASLPPQLLEPESVDEEEPHRDPELVRRMMNAYQRGTQLGRSEAAGDPSARPDGDSGSGRARPGGTGPRPTPSTPERQEE